METRNVTISLEKAREWYNSGNNSLKEVALQAFTKKELTKDSWESITNVPQAIEALGMCPSLVNRTLETMPAHIGKLYLLSLVKKALNSDWEPNMNEGTVYYPWLRYYPKGNSYNKDIWTAVADFKDISNEKVYTLVGGGYGCCGGGLGGFGCGYGVVVAYHGLLGCKSPEIAKHFGKHFGRLIFDAIYSQYNNYIWV